MSNERTLSMAEAQTQLKHMLSPTALSVLYTKSIAAQHDPRQQVPDNCGVPEPAIRKLQAQLILEEAFETIHALGCSIGLSNSRELECVLDNKIVSLEDIIDGCCDLNYVSTGTLMACGALDVPHMQEVCRANNAKFIDGKAIVNEHGKYLKPPGWSPPNHKQVWNRCSSPNLNQLAKRICI